jgi:Icc-related predicted phosphoesterase
MKIWVVSDLHINHYPWVPSRIPEHDVMIVAGDVSDNTGVTLRELQSLHRRTGLPIVFVPGNHDVFDGPLNGFKPDLRGPIHVLPSGQSIIIDGVRFIGATLWTDWELYDTEFASQSWAARTMPEYTRVYRDSSSDLIWPTDTSNVHDAHKLAIGQELRRIHDGPSIVVTHHAPSPRSCIQPLAASDAAFASDLEQEILRWRPTLWVHGHIHRRSDYHIGGTRVLANPRGA